MKEKKNMRWTYRHFISSIVLKISDRNLRLLQTEKCLSLTPARLSHLLETLTLPMLTWPFLDTILFLSFSWCGSKLRKCLPAISLLTISPRPSLDLADSLLPLRELAQVECSLSAWPSSGRLTRMCLIPPRPSSTVTRVGLSPNSSSSSSRSESKTSSDVEVSCSGLTLELFGLILLHQLDIFFKMQSNNIDGLQLRINLILRKLILFIKYHFYSCLLSQWQFQNTLNRLKVIHQTLIFQSECIC